MLTHALILLLSTPLLAPPESVDLESLLSALSSRDDALTPAKWEFAVYAKNKPPENPTAGSVGEHRYLTGKLWIGPKGKRLELDNHREGQSQTATWNGRELLISHRAMTGSQSLVTKAQSENSAFDQGAFPTSYGFGLIGKSLSEFVQDGFSVIATGRETISGVDCVSLIVFREEDGIRSPMARFLVDDAKTLLAWQIETLAPASNASNRRHPGVQFDGRSFDTVFRWRITRAYSVNGIWLPSEGIQDSPGILEADVEYLRLEVDQQETQLGRPFDRRLFDQALKKGTRIQDEETGKLTFHNAHRPEIVHPDSLESLIAEIADEEGLPLERAQPMTEPLDVSCGVTAAYMFSRLYSLHASPKEVLTALPHGIESEVTLDQIQSALASGGRDLYCYSSDLSTLADLDRYVLAHLENHSGSIGHFVLAKATDTDLHIADPIDGRHSVSLESYEEATSGQIRYLTDFEIPHKRARLLSRSVSIMGVLVLCVGLTRKALRVGRRKESL